VLNNPNAIEIVCVIAWEARRSDVYYGLADEKPATLLSGSVYGKSWSYAFLCWFSDNGGDQELRNLNSIYDRR